jgi:dipeptidyl aminopeptidase/acylaminoacyl peptidase
MSDPSVPNWERRFRAPIVSMPDWSPHAPERIVFASNESGVWQVHAWDRGTGVRRRVTDHPVGVMDGLSTLDGEGVVWFQDETGDESGRWLMQPFAGGEVRPFVEGLPHGWNEGLAQAPDVVAAAVSDRDGFAVYAAIGGEPAKELCRSTESLQVGGAELGGFSRAGLSADGVLLCLEHGEHGDLIHPALRVIDAKTGEIVGEQLDDGMALHAGCWSPVPGDHRLAIIHERKGDERPAIWDLSTGERVDLPLDLRGFVEVQDWWADGSALLLTNLHEGRDALYRYDLETAQLTKLDTPPGRISNARARPDGSVWYLHMRGDSRPTVLDQAGNEVVAAKGEPPPAARPYVSWHFENPHGQRVHGFYVTPEGEGPFPVMMFVHGGPTYLDSDRWQPEVQAYVDAGFSVGMVNYRGSVGYGREWRDILIGNIGGPELEDVNAGLADLVSRGVADPSRAVIAGWSWGGYITLMELGKHPELWTCGMAGVPVGDYEAGYEDLSPVLQAYDRALLGGTPHEVPELMRERNPIHIADHVRAPVLFIAGEHDTRCPIRQVMLYVEKLEARGHPHQVYLFSTGHSSFDVDERVTQVRTILEFLDRHVQKLTSAGGSLPNGEAAG